MPPLDQVADELDELDGCACGHEDHDHDEPYPAELVVSDIALESYLVPPEEA